MNQDIGQWMHNAADTAIHGVSNHPVALALLGVVSVPLTVAVTAHKAGEALGAMIHNANAATPTPKGRQ